MQLSIELLPAPLGPMMARISCSRTSKLMSVSALTPPKLSEMFFTSRMTSPILRSAMSRPWGFQAAWRSAPKVFASTIFSVALTLPLRPSSNFTAVSMNCSLRPA